MDYKLRKKINNLAEDILESYEISTPITDMDEVVDRLGGRLQEDHRIDLYSDGKVVKGKGDCRFEIRIPFSQSDTRKNFTIAHELGHLFLHMGYKINEELWERSDYVEFNRKGKSEVELQANEFAAAFLMPQKEYKKIMDRYSKGNIVNIGKVAEYFHVSVDAASFRGKWLGYLEW